MIDDHGEIRNLLAEYGHRADSGDGESYAALYTADGELVESGTTITPPAKIAAVANRFAEMAADLPQPSGSKHVTVNSVVHVDGDRATAHSDLLALSLNPERGWHISGVGRYDDDLVRTDEGWRFRRRTVTWYKQLGPDPLNPGFGEGLQQLFEAIMAGQ